MLVGAEYKITSFFHRLQGKIILYEYDDPSQMTRIDQDLSAKDMQVHPKLYKKGDIHITIWYDSHTQKFKWAVGISGSNNDGRDIEFVPLMNHLFNGKITGSHWIKMQDIGTNLVF